MTKEMIDIISNLFSGFAGVCIGGLIAYFINTKLEHDKLKEKQKLLYSVINDVLKQIRTILSESIGDGGLRSPYGYIKNAHEETKVILPLFNNIISEVSILPQSYNKTLTIEVYSELNFFLSNSEKYKIKLDNLKNFRKEMVPENFVTLKCKNYIDYFDIDVYLFAEEKKEKSVIDKDFFKAQKDLINDLVYLSGLTMNQYMQLITKIDTILNNDWEAKK